MCWIVLVSKKLKTFETRKMFYSEYLYKLVFRNELNNIFRSDFKKKEKLNFARIELDTLTEQKRNGSPMYKKQWRTVKPVSENDYYDAVELYSRLKDREDYKLRIDPNCCVTLFSNDKEFLLDFANKLKTPNIEFWEPNQLHLNLLKSATKIVIVDYPPKLSLKVWFNSKRINDGFAQWLEANPDKCKIGKVAFESLQSYGYLNGLYIYLRDEKVLNLITIIAGASIRNVEKLVYKEDIDKYMYGSE